MYADDIALVTEDVDNLRVAADLLDSTFTQWGLTVSTAKTKLLVVGSSRDADDQAANLNITLRGVRLEAVSKFKYLGSMITSDNTLDAEISHRIASAGYAWHQLKVAKVWGSKYLTRARKVLIFKSIVLAILLYGCEVWPALKRHLQRLEVFQMNCLRFLCGYTWEDRQTNIAVTAQCHVPSITGEVCYRRLSWLGHIARMPVDRLPLKVLFSQLLGPGVRGRPRESWRSIVLSDLTELRIQNDWFTVASDRLAWRQLIESVRT